MLCRLIGVSFFFVLVDLKSQVDLRLLNDLRPFFAIPRYFSTIRYSSLLNICPNTLPPSRSWSSSSYILRLIVERLLDFSDIILLIGVANPIQSSFSYEGGNVHDF